MLGSRPGQERVVFLGLDRIVEVLFISELDKLVAGFTDVLSISDLAAKGSGCIERGNYALIHAYGEV